MSVCGFSSQLSAVVSAALYSYVSFEHVRDYPSSNLLLIRMLVSDDASVLNKEINSPAQYMCAYTYIL